jgi:hypothetical protein
LPWSSASAAVGIMIKADSAASRKVESQRERIIMLASAFDS